MSYEPAAEAGFPESRHRMPKVDGYMVMIPANFDTSGAVSRRRWVCGTLPATRAYATHVARRSSMSDVDQLVSDWTSSLSFGVIHAALSAASVLYGMIYKARGLRPGAAKRP